MIGHDFLLDVVGSGIASNEPDVVGVPGDDGHYHDLHWKEIPWSLLIKKKKAIKNNNSTYLTDKKTHKIVKSPNLMI